ncbi:MAG: IS1096 element passenger TnpR family protein, partial [Actinomycetes bacterium]
MGVAAGHAQACAAHGYGEPRWRWGSVVLRSAFMRTVRLRVRMREVVPRVVRVIDVPAACTLDELHELLQAALGWT